MSKLVRERLQQTIRCLEEATHTIEAYSKEQMSETKELLADAQDLAIALGTRIEALKGLGTRTVNELENYCEGLFRVNQCVQTPELCMAADELAAQIERVRAAFDRDFPDKKEIVFLPYKASMWDSLESVWKAADADPECEAYVIPIPYYDKNPDGTFREYHYEGDLYPDYVPIVRYDEYNLAERHPDVIYIHNPYDNCNYVTTIDPQYYSSELRKYTNCLVYIPYFVVDDTRDISKLEHFALCPAVFYADYTIVQSEKVREKYVEILNKYFEGKGQENSDYSERIIGIGSPKFDGVRRNKPELQDLPKEWRNIIGNGNKKIVFYNTHLSMLMPTYYERFLLKLKGVLAYFKQRKDVILLWRPHPLTIQTIRSMNPIALAPYLEIVNQYKAEAWGIYDDTADMDRSIALSDAYYGSDSSVVAVYRLTGKPVLLHSPDVPTEVV